MIPISENEQLQKNTLVKLIQNSQSFIITTHKQCDADGLGSALAMLYALKKMGKSARLLLVDDLPDRYNFLNKDLLVQTYNSPHTPIEDADVALIFDTNSESLVNPLYKELKKHCKYISFIDHHPFGDTLPTEYSFIQVHSASTGELVFDLIQSLNVSLDKKIARSLYSSIAFDTQVFRYIRGSSRSLKICAELLEYEKEPEKIHNYLFASYSKNKISLLAEVFATVEYPLPEVVIAKVRLKDLEKHNLKMDDVRDILDLLMSIREITIGAFFREDHPNEFKLSLRSKGFLHINSIAKHFGGGGHKQAAGALIKGDYSTVKNQVLKEILKTLEDKKKAS
ncbi:MAG: bifunctional oligoribonuclease/PAP phosphatase NrnA [Bdellovibrionaceae bacterium]|nr:bifunctional oligoribonuclease/PAP phosphatase NrnA [Pseudobdellovibrionaceae bacterium]